LVKPVYDRLHGYVFAQPIVGADETRWRLLAPRGHKGSSKTWCVWVLTTPNAVVYSLEPCKLAGVNPAAYLREAVLAGIREKPIALPHEWGPLATPPAP
jgi:hypothetical protein